MLDNHKKYMTVSVLTVLSVLSLVFGYLTMLFSKSNPSNLLYKQLGIALAIILLASFIALIAFLLLFWSFSEFFDYAQQQTFKRIDKLSHKELVRRYFFMKHVSPVALFALYVILLLLFIYTNDVVFLYVLTYLLILRLFLWKITSDHRNTLQKYYERKLKIKKK
jgi:hypothetical protein